MRLPHYRPSKKAVFAWLMAASVVTALLPPQVGDAAKHGTQLLVALQDVAYAATHWAARSGSRIGDPQRDRQMATESLIRQIAAQQGLIEQLREENRRLGALRDRRIPQALQARIVARDTAEARDSVLIERGTELDVRPEDWVTSRLFIDQGRVNDVRKGQAVVAREVLLGRVEQASPYMSRVRLFTDIDGPPVEVRVGGMEDGRFAFVPYPCSLRGLGRGRMIIRDVDYRFVEPGEGRGEEEGSSEEEGGGDKEDRREGAHHRDSAERRDTDMRHAPGARGDAAEARTTGLERRGRFDGDEAPRASARAASIPPPRRMRVGDYVCSAPGRLGLPEPLVIGRVTAIEADPKRRLVYDVIVESAIPLDEIRDVYVIPLIPTGVAMD